MTSLVDLGQNEANMLRIAQEALTFDDVLLQPGYSEVTAKDVSLVTRLSRNIRMNIPLVSAAMDTVTEARLAIALAQEGGIGIIHKNMTVAEQADQVRRVKKYESGVVKDPIPSKKVRRWASFWSSPGPMASQGCRSCEVATWWALSPGAILALKPITANRSRPS